MGTNLTDTGTVNAADLGIPQESLSLADMLNAAKSHGAALLKAADAPPAPIDVSLSAAAGNPVPSPQADMPSSPQLGMPGQPAAVAPAYPAARNIEAGDVDPSGRMTAQGMIKYGQSGVSPDAMSLAQAAWQNSQAGIAHEKAAITDAAGDINVAGANREAGAQLKLASDTAKNEDLAPIYAQRALLDKKNAAEMQQMYSTATQETTAQMVRVRQAANDAANAQVKDFWADKSTSGRIMGVISQALAGAANGLSGQPGAPTPLDRIINMDLEKQKINLNNKNVAAQREEGILGTMQRQFDSNMAAHGAAYIAAVGQTDALAKQVAQKYATPEAMSVYQQFHADNLEKVAAATSQLHGSLLSANVQQAGTAAQIMDRIASSNAAIRAAELKAANTKGGHHIMGVRGMVGTQEFNALQEHAQATATSLRAYEGIQDLMKNPKPVDPAWINQFNLLASEAFAARRIDQKTGARLEGKEAERVETGVPKLSEGMLGKFTNGKDLLGINAMLGNMVHTSAGQYAARAQAVTGGELDYDDPMIGHHFKSIAMPGKAN